MKSGRFGEVQLSSTWIKLQTILKFMAAVVSLGTGPLSKIVPVSHFDTKT